MSLSTLKYQLGPLVAPALTSSAILLGLNFMLGKSQVDWKESMYDVGSLFISQLSTSVILSLLPTFSTSKYGSLMQNGEALLLVPVLSAVIYEWIYSQSIREQYDNYSNSLKDPMWNLGLGFSAVLASQMISGKVVDMIL